jgi:hypothetical protein
MWLGSLHKMPIEDLIRRASGVPVGGFHRFPVEPLTAEQIATANAIFAELIGLPLTDMWRYAGCQKFEFGEQLSELDDNSPQMQGAADWGLVASCEWQIQGPEELVLSSDHFGPEGVRRDGHAQPFYDLMDSDSHLVVQSVKTLEDGGLVIQLTGGYSLNLWRSPKENRSDEQWRLMPPGEESGHLVLDDNELEWSGLSKAI